MPRQQNSDIGALFPARKCARKRNATADFADCADEFKSAQSAVSLLVAAPSHCDQIEDFHFKWKFLRRRADVGNVQIARSLIGHALQYLDADDLSIDAQKRDTPLTGVAAIVERAGNFFCFQLQAVGNLSDELSSSDNRKAHGPKSVGSWKIQGSRTRCVATIVRRACRRSAPRLRRGTRRSRQRANTHEPDVLAYLSSALRSYVSRAFSQRHIWHVRTQIG